jgi:hypothetical protein
VAIDKIGPGRLLLGTGTPTEFSTQISQIKITRDITEEDGIKTLADVDPTPTMTVNNTLEGEALQDFQASDGFQKYCDDNSGQTVGWEFVPDSTGQVAFSGDCQIRPTDIGGEVGAAAETVTWAFPIKGDVIWGTPSVLPAAKAAAGTGGN